MGTVHTPTGEAQVHYLCSLGLGPGVYAAELQLCEDFALSIYVYTLELEVGLSVYTAVNHAMHDPARTSATAPIKYCLPYCTSNSCRQRSRRSRNRSCCMTVPCGRASSMSSLATMVAQIQHTKCMIRWLTSPSGKSSPWSSRGTSSCRRRQISG